MLGTALGASQIRSNLLHHFRSVFRTLPTDCVGLDILVKAFVWIQLRTVAWQEKHPDICLMDLEPTLDSSRTMHGMTINDQKHFLSVVPNQASQKPDHDRCCKPFGKNHKRQSPSVRNGRDHVAAKTLARARNHRRLSFGTVTSSGLVIRSHSHFIAPVYLGTLLTRLASDGGVVVFQPVLDRFWVLLVGSTQGLLGREAPSLQITSNRPDRHRNTVSSLYQLPNSLSGPQDKRHFQLIGTTVGNQADDGSGLMTSQTRAPLGTTFARLQRSITALAVCLEPIVNRGPSHTKDPTGLGLGHVLFENRMNKSMPKFLLGFWRKMSPPPGKT